MNQIKPVPVRVAAVAAALLAGIVCPGLRASSLPRTQDGAAPPSTPQVIHLEAEDGELAGTSVLKEGTGFSGTGYVSGFEAAAAAVRFHHVVAAAGIYEARARYRTAGRKADGSLSQRA